MALDDLEARTKELGRAIETDRDKVPETDVWRANLDVCTLKEKIEVCIKNDSYIRKNIRVVQRPTWKKIPVPTKQSKKSATAQRRNKGREVSPSLSEEKPARSQHNYGPGERDVGLAYDF